MLVDEDETQGNFDQVENETQQPVEQVVAQEETKPIIPEKYQGKSVDDIIRMHQEAEKLIGKQAQEVGEVRKLADDLIKQNLQTNHKPIVEEPEVDFFEDPQKAIRRTVDQHPDVLAAKQATQDFKRMNIQQKLAATHPDFQQVVQDAGFTEWVKASPVRLGLYAKADGEYDFDSANELLSTYKQLKQVQTKQVAAVDNTVRQQSLKAASVDVGGTGESSKKIYRRADLIQLRMRDPDRYEALQPEIMAAYAEGRIK
jgi:putative ubiquitin-RnfH superfamily antitoxin RatB of RatAB toxin-antitoxin module